MSETVIKKTTEIKAPPATVWRVFTDPAVTRQIGGEYVTDWKTGSTFGWKGLDGRMHTRGTILHIEKEKLLQHNLLDPEGSELITSVITYSFEGKDGYTILSAVEEMAEPLAEEEYEEASAGWDLALMAVKETAEKLHGMF